MNRAKNVACLAVFLAGFASGLQARIKLQSGSLWNGQQRFVVRGVAYSNLPIGERPFGPKPPAPCLYARDLPLIAALGANTVRTYALVPEGDTAFTNVLQSAQLYWLAGFPLDPFYDPARNISAKKDQILQAFRDYASQFRGQQRLIAYVFGNEVARDYNAKFAGSPAEFYALLDDVAAILRGLEPDDTPLLTTAVSDPAEFRNDSAGLSFWSWNAYPGRSFSGQLQLASQKTTKPVLISEYGVDAFDQRQGQENEAAQSDAALMLASEIQSASFLLGGVYAEFADQWWKGGPDAGRHGFGGTAIPAFPDGFRNDAWQGIFRSIAAEQPGLDTLRPRAVFRALATLWGGKVPASWSMDEPPAITRLENAASAADFGSPGALVRIIGKSLAEANNSSPADDVWPLHLGLNCLCVGNTPAPLGSVSAELATAQAPWSLAPGDAKVVLFRAGLAGNFLPTRIRKYSPGIFPGAVVRSGSDCRVNEQNGVRPGEALEVYGTGFGPATTTPADIKAVVNGVPARVFYAGLVPSLVGLNQVNLQVDPNTPPSSAASLELRMEEIPSNLYWLSIPGPADKPAIILRPSKSEIVLQPGGEPQALDISVEGANGFCGAVFFNSPSLPDGISYRIPVGFVGQKAPLLVSASADARTLQSAKLVLDGYGGGASAGEIAIGLTVLPNQGDIPVRVVSGGYQSKPLSRFDWYGRTLFSTAGGGAGRGLNVVAVNPDTGLLSPVRNFDTWGDDKASPSLVAYLSGLPSGSLVMFSVADEASYRLSPEARYAIAAWFGSQFIVQLGYQQSWALIGRKGARVPIAEGSSLDMQVILDRVLTFPMP